MKEYIEPPRGATLEELYLWAKRLCELLNRTDESEMENNGEKL